jgi:hypothetical protein
MNNSVTRLVLAALTVAAPSLFAQIDFKVADRAVQVHSFGAQGFMYSNQNNYLSLPTSDGSFAFTDGGANISTQLTDKLRVGAQIYIRNVGEFGNWRPELDWAFGDYKFKNWFGIRAGKVKTALGLYNDVQDMDSLHTFALLPEAVYPIDWRSITIAHIGGDVYGNIDAKRLGNFGYTAYIGLRPQDPNSGYTYAAKAGGTIYDSLGGKQMGGDLRWTMPFGVVLGASYIQQDITGIGAVTVAGVVTPSHQDTKADQLAQYYAQYTLKGFRFDAEYRRNLRDVNLYRNNLKFSQSIVDSRGSYFAGAYRVAKHLELGAYRSIYYVDTRKDTNPPAMHHFDTAVCARIDLNNHWYAKVEGHFVDGAPTSPSASRGLYALSNPSGILPTTNLLVIRTGFSF